jgi:hypothetical protein
VANFNCTYVPFHLNSSTPELQVPPGFDGTVTSFSVNAGSTGGKVELRVLRPEGGGQFKGAGTSPAETITNTGGQTFNISLPVKAGDVLGLDNASSAVLFDNTDATYFTQYYQPMNADGTPGLPDNTTAAPNNQANQTRLLLSAVVQSSGTTTSTGTSSGTSTGTTSTSTPTGPAPAIASPTQSHRTWREGNELPVIARKRPPVGTTFSFKLNEKAQVVFTFTQQLPGRRVKGKCVAPTRHNRHNRKCTRNLVRGTLSFVGHAGTNKVFFEGRLSNGRRLKPASYTLAIIATNSARQSSNRASLRFTIVR